jgi:hypothetical protein
MPDPGNPYRSLQIPGKGVEQTEEGARAQCDALAEHSLGQHSDSSSQGETRVLSTIQPERGRTQGKGRPTALLRLPELLGEKSMALRGRPALALGRPPMRERVGEMRAARATKTQ